MEPYLPNCIQNSTSVWSAPITVSHRRTNHSNPRINSKLLSLLLTGPLIFSDTLCYACCFRDYLGLDVFLWQITITISNSTCFEPEQFLNEVVLTL